MEHIMTSKHQLQAIIGQMLLLIDDQDFVHGYTNGYETFHTYRSTGNAVDTSTLLFLLKNGWNAGYSDQWNTGYIMGWLAAFYEQEEGQLALSTDVSALCDPEWEKERGA